MEIRSNKFYITAIFFIFIFISPRLFAWNQAGHALIILIAYEQLSPDEKNQLLKLISWEPHHKASITTLLLAATWPDYIKGRGVTAFNSWHYKDAGFVLSNAVRKSSRQTQEDLLWAIELAQLKIRENPTPLTTAVFLRFLIHFFGDLHQPLHTISLYNHLFPNGDRGGNLYHIFFREKQTNLHVIWDQCFGLLNHHSFASLFPLAKHLETRYPITNFSVIALQGEPIQWFNQTHAIAISFVYTQPYAKNISFSYQKKGKNICARQLVLAAYRLSYLLKEVLLENKQYGGLRDPMG